MPLRPSACTGNDSKPNCRLAQNERTFPTGLQLISFTMVVVRSWSLIWKHSCAPTLVIGCACFTNAITSAIKAHQRKVGIEKCLIAFRCVTDKRNHNNRAKSEFIFFQSAGPYDWSRPYHQWTTGKVRPAIYRNLTCSFTLSCRFIGPRFDGRGAFCWGKG